MLAWKAASMIVALTVALAVVVLALVAVAVYAARGASRGKGPGIEEGDVQRLVAALAERSSELQARSIDSATHQVMTLAQSHLRQETERGERALDVRGEQIDRRLGELRQEVARMQEAVRQIDASRGESVASVATRLEQTTAAVARLEGTTGELKQALAGHKARGQWGERMAEDVLRLAGFVEGVQYVKQRTLPGGGRPDFTFLLPNRLELHMDVKFPLDAYLRVLEAGSDESRHAALKEFKRDARKRVKEVTEREYVDPARGTVDCCLVFIPNEQVYGFLHEHDSGLLDYALGVRVVLCSPLTLFAILAVVRQSVETVELARQTDEILRVLGAFSEQWGKYREAMGKLGDRIDGVRKQYDHLVTTRTNMLDAQVRKVDGLREGREMEEGEDGAVTPAEAGRGGDGLADPERTLSLPAG